MSGKCAWCFRNRPTVSMKVDGLDLVVCDNCRAIIKRNRERRDADKQSKKERRAAAGAE